MPRLTSVRVALLLCLLVLGIAPTPSAAQPYPNRPIRLIVPYGPGGVVDLAARAVGEGLRSKLGQPIVIDNKPGANGIVGMELLTNTKPDGYTLLIGGLGSHGIPPAVNPNFPFDVLRDFTAIAMVSEFVNVMVVNKEAPVHTVAEFVDYAKARPGALNFAISGTGSSNHLTGELFMLRTGTKMVPVPYKGGSGYGVADLMAGNIQVIFDNLPAVLQHIKSGSIKPLAVTSRARSVHLPEIKTMEESGIADFNVTSWISFFGPRGLPDEITKQLSDALVAVVAEPETAERLRNIGFQPNGVPTAPFLDFFKSELARWKDVVTTAGIKAEP